ncbi:MAG: APC family permease [Phycisphaerales bacterium]|nr:APC family permease [Phycisphaerales bacterium]
MSDPTPLSDGPLPPPPQEEPTWFDRGKRLVLGPPRDLRDRRVFHRLSIVAFLAWVGLGADGLSSSAYGPEEAFRTLGSHTYLAIALAVVTATTVIVISIAYSGVIEEFPQGGGGYLVATKLLGDKAGVVSGCALLVDYVLTITISIAAAGDALFSFLPLPWHEMKLPAEVLTIVALTLLNLRGTKESVLTLTPFFLLFVLTHAVLIGVGIAIKAPQFPGMLKEASTGFSGGLSTLGFGGLLLLFTHAYSLGGGTYTGIEAVSNGLSIMREPRVQTGKRTMVYMAASLALTAGGLLFNYLLWDVTFVEGKTLNAVLVERFVEVVPLGGIFVILTLAAEGAILVVAAQAGFTDGPRVLSNMALDSWVPRRFASLSDRLTTQNGILMMGLASLAALVYTRGDVRHIVVMYSINVFITFSMTELSMVRLWWERRRERPDWKKRNTIHVAGLGMCLTILIVTVLEKFLQGGWITLVITGGLIALCFWIRRHYRTLNQRLSALFAGLIANPRLPRVAPGKLDPHQPTAAVLVGGYSGLGIHTIMTAFKNFPSQFKNVVFVSVSAVDSGAFRAETVIEEQRRRTEQDLQRYVDFVQAHGIPATSRTSMATDVITELEKVCEQVAQEFPRVTFFAGQLVFQRERWYQPLLHNQTAFALQKRLHWAGLTMVILPTRVPG